MCKSFFNNLLLRNSDYCAQHIGCVQCSYRKRKVTDCKRQKRSSKAEPPKA